MGGGNTGAGASKHFVNVPQRDVTGKYPLINICYSDAANHYHAALRQAGIVPAAKHWLKTAILSIFGNVNNDIGCNERRHHPAAIARRARQEAAELGHRNRQQAEALRRRMHRHELLAAMGRK